MTEPALDAAASSLAECRTPLLIGVRLDDLNGLFGKDVRFFAFSMEVIDLSESVDDPLALLMEVQVGGGTHIGLGLRAAREAIANPSRTIVVLVTDFEEGVSLGELLAEVRMLADSGAKLLGLAALADDAKPRYHSGTAAAVVAAGMPVAAVSPDRLAKWVGDRIREGGA